MKYRVNPLGLEELKQRARERLGFQHSQDIAALSSKQVQCLVEDLAASKLELEIQNEYLYDAHTKLEYALNQARDLYDFAPVGCISINEARMITRCNLWASGILGLDRARLLQMPLDLCLVEEDRSIFHALLSQVVQTHEPQHGEVRILSESAIVPHVQLDVVGLPQTQGYQVIITDITAKKKSDLLLQSREERWKFALDTSADGVWDWHVDSGLVSYSEKLAKLYGYSANDFGGTLEAWRALVHPDDQVTLTGALQRCIKGEDTRLSCEFRMLCRGGTWKWILCRGAAFSETSLGMAERVIGTHTDITKAKTLEVSLRNALDTQKAAFDSIAHPIALLDDKGRILQANTAWKCYDRSVGFEQQLDFPEVPQDWALGILPSADAELQRKVVDGVRAVIQQSKCIFQLEYPYPSPAGEKIMLMEATPVVDGLARVLVSHHDITASLQLRGDSLEWVSFYQTAQSEFTRALRYSQPLMLLVFTIQFGLCEGEKADANTTVEARKQVVHFAQSVLRASDVLGSIGSDGYVVMLPNTLKEGGEVLALRIIEAVISNPISVDGIAVPVTLSIGASCLNGDETFAALLGRAVSASRESQRGGANRVTVDTSGAPCLWGDVNAPGRSSESH
jgi:PAS domain S-box-containing protein/diguanylate cyclase (GGDEF)-like protein